MESSWLVAALAALFLLSGMFSGSETALFSLDRFRLRRFERSTSARERRIAAVAARPERLLAGILFGNTLVNIASSSAAVALAQRLEWPFSPDTSVLIAVVADTFLLLVLGEILPKGLAVQWPAAIAKFYIGLLAPILRVVQPAAQLLEGVARGILRLAGVRSDRHGSGLSRPELQLLFEDMQDEAGFTEDEGTLAANIFDFFETRAWEIMTPRVDLSGIPVDIAREALVERVKAARHSRLPVYRDSLDQIIGFINAKEFLLDPGRPMEEFLKPVHFVPDRARVHHIFGELQSRRLSMVVVVNEYGGTSGIITGEDLVEEIVGEIFHEHERDQEPELVRTGEGTWRVDGLISLSELGHELELKPPPGPAPTVAGHVAHLLGRPPRAGESVRDGALTFTVLQVLRHRARRVEVAVDRAASAGEETP